MVRQWSPVCRAIVRLLGPHAEVVVHDRKSDTVLGIWGSLSGREAGEPSLLGELDTLTPSEPDVYGPYEKLLAGGRRLSSVSAMLDDVVLCINFERTSFEEAARVLAAFAAPAAAAPEPLVERDWVEWVGQTIDACVRESGRAVERLTREDRLAVLTALEERGVFRVRKAVPLVARALRVSRSTLYTLLTETKRTEP
ncbi:transcriptional regulator [Pendulispora rubella]|uniref:helix-turn-helix transcriptional regulator n=1 Tax=Pendulispora rubella TaxID=2741070 RepID=UPI0030E5264F